MLKHIFYHIITATELSYLKDSLVWHSLGQFLYFHMDGEVSGYGWVIVLLKLSFVFSWLASGKGSLTVIYVRLHYHFLSYLCQCPHQYRCKRKKNKRVNQTEADIFTLPYCIEYNNIEVSYVLLLIFQVLLWWRELEINLKLVPTFKSTTLRVYKDREGKWKHQTSQI